MRDRVHHCLRLSSWLLAAILLMVPARAFAQRSSDAKVAAEALFDEGKRLMKAQSYGEACAKFAASQEMDPALGTLLNLANCYEKVGRTASAWAAFREAGDLAKTAGDTKRVGVARERAAALEPKLSRLTLKVPGERQVPGLRVVRDGAAVNPALYGAAIPVDPGLHVVVATADGYKSFQEEVRVEGEGRSLEVVVPALEALPPPPVSPPPVEEAAPLPSPSPEAVVLPAPSATALAKGVKVATTEPRPRSKRRIVASVFMGLGVVGVATGSYFGLDALSKHQEFQDACDPGVDCDETDVRLEREAKTAGDRSTIALAVGGSALLTGLILWWTAPSAEAPPSSAQIAPHVGADSFGMVISGGF